MAERIDLFRRALAGAARAIAKDSEVEVVFASDHAPASGKTARVASPGPALEPRLVAEARGAADSAALRLRYQTTLFCAFEQASDASVIIDALCGHEDNRHPGWASEFHCSVDKATVDAIGRKPLP